MSYIQGIAQSLVDLANFVEQNAITNIDVCDRVEQIMENLAEYSAITDTDVNQVATENLSSVLDNVARSAVSQVGRPSLNVPFSAIENYLVCGFRVKEIADLFGVSKQTSHQRMQSHRFRIERLWRDVYTQVLDPFHVLFHNLEREGMLNPDDEIHLFALHWTFLPQLKKQLSFFMDAWNNHSLRTAGSQSPYQLWTAFRNLEDPDQVEVDYGIDWDGPYGYDDLGGGGQIVEVPEVELQRDLTAEDMDRLPDPNVPFLDAPDIYMAMLQLLRN